MNTTKWIRAFAVAGVATAVSVAGRSARSVSTLDSPAKKALLEELEQACITASIQRRPKLAASDCGCLKLYHADSTDERYLRPIINTYTGREAYDSAGITDELSIALENDSTALAKCASDPRWFRKKGAR